MITPILLLVVALLGWSAALIVNITPKHVHIPEEMDPLTVRCVADAPITHCQFRISSEDTQKPVVDLSSGRLSNVSHFTYEGDGLLAGHCGAIIGPAALPDWWFRGTVECRVRSANSDWVYATMSVDKNNYELIPLTIESRLVVMRPGGEVNLLFQAEEALTTCEFKHPQQRGWANLQSRTTCGTLADSVCYHGPGMSERQCGATIKNVTDRSNGMHWFHVGTSWSFERTHVQVIVTKPPSTPVLSANTTIDEDGTMTLRAMCTVVGSRPAANITWVLDEEVVTGGEIDFFPSDTWVRQYEEQNSTQQLTLKLSEAMYGKQLSCVVLHVALRSPIRSNPVMITAPSVAMVEHRVRQSNMPELHQIQMQVERARARVEEDNALAAKDNALAAKDNALAAKDNALAAKDNALAAKDNALAAKDNALAAKDNALAAKDNALAAKDNALAAEDNALAAKAHARAEEQNALAAKENALAAQAHTRAEEAAAKNAEEELEFQRALRKIKLQQLAVSTTTDN